MSNSYLELSLNQIKPDPNQPRQHFDETALKELSQSIKENGVLQPIRVRKNGSGYLLIAGERRWRASAMAGLVTIPAVVCETADDKVLTEQIIENLQREGMGYMEEARAVGRLREDLALDVKEICRMLGKDPNFVYDCLSLCKMPPSVQLNAEKKQFTRAVAVMISRLPEAGQQIEAASNLRRERGSLVSIAKAKEYLSLKYGERRVSVPKQTPLQKEGKEYVANWKQYLVNFTVPQFVRFQSVVRGRTDTSVLAEAVDIVMRESEQKV